VLAGVHHQLLEAVRRRGAMHGSQLRKVRARADDVEKLHGDSEISRRDAV
jgi:hypothetical protein